jgi:methylmalonyl-CoA epimerase
MLKQIDHIGIVVRSLGDSLETLEKLFKLKAKYIEVVEDAGVRMAFIPVGEVMLELIEPLSPGKGEIGEFLASQGEGFHHICYKVNDLKNLLIEMKKAGVGLIDEEPRPGAANSWIVFLKPDETNSVLTELVEREKDL